MELKLTKRQEDILKTIIEEYTNNAIPIGSNLLINKFFNKLSSATIRNDMVILEKMNLIIKSYSCSGRTPTLLGYEYYEKYLDKNIISDEIRVQLKDILSKRSLSIDETISLSIDIINEATSLPSVVTKIVKNDLLKKIDLVRIDFNKALIILITSNGEISKKEIELDEKTSIDDIIICVNIFNDRLVDTPMNEIKDKVVILEKIIKTKIKSHEFIIQDLIIKIFDNLSLTKHTVSGSNKLLSQPEYNDINKLKQILALLDDVTIWKQIAYNRQSTGKSSIIFNDKIGIDNTSIASTNININNVSHEISVVGPNRLTYAKVKTLLNFLKEEIEGKFDENKKNK